MRTSFGLLPVLFVLFACSGVNFFPTLNIAISPPSQADDAKKVGEAVSSVGFVRIDQSETAIELGTKPAVLIMSWVSPVRKSTKIDLVKVTATGEQFVHFTETGIQGRTLNGPPCQQFLDIVSALRKLYAAEPRRLTVSGTCDPNGLDDAGRRFGE
jgi:hypothetical protein